MESLCTPCDLAFDKIFICPSGSPTSVGIPTRLEITSAIPGIADVISSRVGIPTEVGDPLGQMKISSKAKSQGVHKDSTALLTACGLALRSFD